MPWSTLSQNQSRTDWRALGVAVRHPSLYQPSKYLPGAEHLTPAMSCLQPV